MSSVLIVMITDLGRTLTGDLWMGPLKGKPHHYIKYLKFGEGGWEQTLAGKVPKDPRLHTGGDNGNDIEADGSPGNTFFQKDFLSSDVSRQVDGAIRYDCKLDFGEGNDNGFGDDPGYFEIGLFDQFDNLIAYGTFPEETKNIQKILLHHIDIYFNSEPEE